MILHYGVEVFTTQAIDTQIWVALLMPLNDATLIWVALLMPLGETQIWVASITPLSDRYPILGSTANTLER